MKIIIASLIFLFLFHETLPQHGVGTQWGTEVILPVRNSGSKQRGVLFNNMVTTSNGRIIISTTEINATTNQVIGFYLTYSDDGGTTWLNPPRQFTPTSMVTGPGSIKLAIDLNDTLYVLWSARNPAAIFISKLDKNLNVIKDSIRIASKVTNYTNIDMVTHFTIDRFNRIHVMWHEGNPGTIQRAESFYSRSTNRGLSWSLADTLSMFDGRHSAFPHSEFDVAGDTLSIVWRDSTGGAQQWDIYGVVSTNGGLSWTNPILFIGTNHADWDPNLLVDNRGRFHLAYHVYPASNPFWGARVEYRYSDNLGATWQTPSNPSNGQLSEPGKRSQLVECFRYDTQRNLLWFAWKDERDFDTSSGNARADMMVIYSTNRGISWSLQEFSTDRYDSSIGFKAGVILPNGNYCVNYEVMSPGDINNPNTFIRVYFRKRDNPVISVKWNNSFIPQSYGLYQNYPNPFNQSTIIYFTLPKTEHTVLKIFDITGREVVTLVNAVMYAGVHSVVFNSHNISSGLYIARLQAGNTLQRLKMVLNK